MTNKTIQDGLNDSNLTTIAQHLNLVKFGDLLATMGSVPTLNTRTALASNAVQVHDTPGTILAVSSGGLGLTIVPDGIAPAAGQVAVAYDANGLGTLTFNAAVTAYKTQERAISTASADAMAALPATLATLL